LEAAQQLGQRQQANQRMARRAVCHHQRHRGAVHRPAFQWFAGLPAAVLGPFSQHGEVVLELQQFDG